MPTEEDKALFKSIMQSTRSSMLYLADTAFTLGYEAGLLGVKVMKGDLETKNPTLITRKEDLQKLMNGFLSKIEQVVTSLLVAKITKE